MLRTFPPALTILSPALCKHVTIILVFQAVGDQQVIRNVAQILELSVPKMEHPSESFLAQLEEDLSKLILKHGMTVRRSLSLSFPFLFAM